MYMKKLLNSSNTEQQLVTSLIHSAATNEHNMQDMGYTPWLCEGQWSKFHRGYWNATCLLDMAESTRSFLEYVTNKVCVIVCTRRKENERYLPQEG